MVKLGARFFLSAVYLSTRASYLMAGTCCAADSTCSGCWMCTGSDLRTCWDSAVSEADACKEEDLSKQVDCLCASYGKIAFCWSKGRCCTEYAPTLSAATNLCNLKTYPKDQLTKDLVDKAANDAYNVRNTIWHNDSGYDVPKLSVYVKAYSDNSSSATKNQETSSTANKSSASYKARSQTEPSESETSVPNQQSGASPEQSQAQEQYKSKDKKAKTSPNKAHQQGKCLRQQHKRKHNKSRLDAYSQSFVGKRQDGHLSSRHTNNAEMWKRSETLNSSGQPHCGIDFHGVAYPSQVPETVSQVFATL